MGSNELLEIFKSYLNAELKITDPALIAAYQNNFSVAAQKYVEFLYPDAYLTKEKNGWYVRTEKFNNYLGRHVYVEDLAYVDAALNLAKLKK